MRQRLRPGGSPGGVRRRGSPGNESGSPSERSAVMKSQWRQPDMIRCRYFLAGPVGWWAKGKRPDQTRSNGHAFGGQEASDPPEVSERFPRSKYIYFQIYIFIRFFYFLCSPQYKELCNKILHTCRLHH
jgi:hypothetical protein